VPVTDSQEAFVSLSVAGLASCNRSKAGGNYNAGSVTSNKIVNMTSVQYHPLSEEKKQWARAGQLSMQTLFVRGAGRSPHTARLPEASLRGRPGEQLAIFVIPVVEKAWATFSEPTRTYRIFKCAALSIDRPRTLIQNCEKAKPAAA